MGSRRRFGRRHVDMTTRYHEYAYGRIVSNSKVMKCRLKKPSAQWPASRTSYLQREHRYPKIGVIGGEGRGEHWFISTRQNW